MPDPKTAETVSTETVQTTPVTTTPEAAAPTVADDFQNAVAQEVKRQMSGIQEMILAKAAAAQQGGSLDQPTLKWAEALAMTFKELADQGNPTAIKAVPPDEMKRREAAHQQLLKMLEDAYERGDKPHYSLVRTVYLADRKIEAEFVNPMTKRREPQIIYWPDIPNDAMRPANAIAKQIYAKWKETLGDVPSDMPIPPAKRAFLDAATKVVVRGETTAQDEVSPRPGSVDPHLRIPRDTVQVFGTAAPPVVITG